MSPQDISAYLGGVHPDAMVEWREVRETLTKLCRLSEILSQSPAGMLKRATWIKPNNLEAMVDEAEGIMREFRAGPFGLGKEISRDSNETTEFDQEPVPDTTSRGTR